MQHVLAVAGPSAPSKILIPDLVSHCDFPLRTNRHRKQATVECKQWLFRGGNLSDRKRNAFHGLKAGLLTSMCYAKAGYPQLRVCCDFMNWLFHMDNISDDMNNRGTAITGIDVMNAFWLPDKHMPVTRVGKMAKEYVFCSMGRLCRILIYPSVSGGGQLLPLILVLSSVSGKRWISSSRQSPNRPLIARRVSFLISSHTSPCVVIPGKCLDMIVVLNHTDHHAVAASLAGRSSSTHTIFTFLTRLWITPPSAILVRQRTIS